MTRWTNLVGTVGALACVASLAACGSGSDSGEDGKKFKIALSMSYTGNDWQSQATNLVKAQAASDKYKDRVKLRVDVAGTDINKQIQTIDQEVAAGMDAIVVYPLSPTAINPAIERACKAGVVVFAYDSPVTAPCAHNVYPDLQELGHTGAKWLADSLDGKGNVVILRGVPGTTADIDEVKGVKKAFKGTDIKVIAEVEGMWDPAKIKTAFSQTYASNPDIDGVWGVTGCVQVREITKKAGKPVYCAGGQSQGEVQLMAPKSAGGEGVTTHAAVPAPPYDGELAFMLAVDKLEGKNVPKNTVIPTPLVTADEVKIGTNPAEGANVYPADTVSSGFMGEFWSPLVEQGLQAARTGKPDPISDALPCKEVPGCKQFD